MGYIICSQFYNPDLGSALRIYSTLPLHSTANQPTSSWLVTIEGNSYVQNRDLIQLHYPEIYFSLITVTTRVTLLDKLNDSLDLQI